MMHTVQVPDASPVSPGTPRPVKAKLHAPDANVLVGNAVTVVPLWASVPRRLEQKSWRPATSSLASDESLLGVDGTVRLVHAEPLSIVGRFGVAEPDQLTTAVQLPLISSDHELSVPTSCAARSWTLSRQVPAAGWPLNAVIAWLVMTMLSAEPPARLLT